MLSFYKAFTDAQGSILSVFDEYGNKVFDASYDAWGRQTVTQNDIDLHYGYCGHEMLPFDNLIDMGGRVYDSAIGRFLSCDNYVQEPDNSQNFNRYSYCLNNPLRYTDPTGEFWWIPAIIVGSGVLNVAMNIDNIHDFWQGFGYFCVGSASASVAVFGGTAGVIGSGALLGAGNNIVTQGFANGFDHIDWSNVGCSAIMGGITSYFSSTIGNYVSSATGGLFDKIADITLRETLNGTLGGTITGAAMGGIAFANGAEGSFWENVGEGAGFGALGGALGGFAKGRMLHTLEAKANAIANYNRAPTEKTTSKLHRPYVRVTTRRAVENASLRTPDGRFVDVNTRAPIDGQYDLGHKRGFEFWRMKAWAESIGMTQSQFNDFMNNPLFYQIESPHTNRSHMFEYKGPTFIDYFKYLH